MKTMSIDIETFSSEDLRKSGVYRYCVAPDFEILLFACSIDGGEVKVIDFASGEELPPEILKALTDDTVIKYAWNANFERICLSRYLRDRNIIDGYLSPGPVPVLWSQPYRKILKQNHSAAEPGEEQHDRP